METSSESDLSERKNKQKLIKQRKNYLNQRICFRTEFIKAHIEFVKNFIVNLEKEAAADKTKKADDWQNKSLTKDIVEALKEKRELYTHQSL